MINFLLDYYFLPVLGHLLAWFDFEKVRDTEYVLPILQGKAFAVSGVIEIRAGSGNHSYLKDC